MKPIYPPFIKVAKSVFFIDDNRSKDYDYLLVHYVTEMDAQRFRLKLDNTTSSPYWELYREWEERINGRMRDQSERLMATSSLSKMVGWIDNNL